MQGHEMTRDQILAALKQSRLYRGPIGGGGEGDGGAGGSGGGGQGGGAGGSGGTGGAGGSGGSAGGTAGGGTGGSGGGGAAPFATFPDQAAFNARMDREAKSRLEATAKELGFDTVEAMQAAAKAAKEAADKSKTDLEKAKELQQKAERERDSALTHANETLIRATAMVEAGKLGIIDPEAAVALMDRSGVAVKDGKVDGIKASLEALLKAKPYLKGSTTPGKSGSEMGGGGGGGAADMNAFIRRAAGRQ